MITDKVFKCNVLGLETMLKGELKYPLIVINTVVQ